jgi:hypothetical protein
MVLRNVFIAGIGVAALAWSDPSLAQQYRAGEFLNLDLSTAVLSPKPLGPATSFTPGPLDVTVDRGNDAAQPNTESVVEPKTSVVEPKTVPAATVHVERKSATQTTFGTAASRKRAAHARAERSAPRAPRALVALHGRNPLDAQARDTRIQVWPCKSGGICNWKR